MKTKAQLLQQQKWRKITPTSQLGAIEFGMSSNLKFYLYF